MKWSLDKTKPLSKIFTQVYNETNEGFIFIIDEWDYIFNNNLFSSEDREKFLQFLKDLLMLKKAKKTDISNSTVMPIS